MLLNSVHQERRNTHNNDDDNDDGDDISKTNQSLSCPIMSQGISLTFGKPQTGDKWIKLSQNLCGPMI